MRLSILDLVPVRTDQTSADALAATIRLAKVADRLGFTRYWLAEHHNIPSIAATSPAVLVAMLAAQTTHTRVGSGGVMLPNHAPLAVAEQFALLEAAYPGRIDLGVGRAPGSDPVTSAVLRAGRDDREVDQFGDHLDDVLALLGSAGVVVQLPDRPYQLKATPYAVTTPRVFLLGSSMYSARLAAAKGLPYVFGYHLFGEQASEALALYRSQFVPTEHEPEPVTMVTVNAVVAENRTEATKLMLPNLQVVARLATGDPLGPLDLADEAQNARLSLAQQRIVETELSRAVLGTPAQVAGELRELVDRFDVDEVMLNPVASARRGDDPTTAPAREATLELVAESLF